MAEAELLVSRLEDAMEFAKGKCDESQKTKQSKTGQDMGKQQNQKSQQWKPQQQQRVQNQGGNVVTTFRPPQYPPGLYRGTGRGGPSQPGPHRPQQVANHPATRPTGVPGGRGQGRGRQQRPRLAYIQAREDGTLVLVDDDRPESTQQVDGEETGAFRGQSSEN